MKRVAQMASTAGGALLALGLACDAFAAESGPERAARVTAAITAHDAAVGDPAQRELKRAAMNATPFTFYRATAHLFYQDIAEKRLPTPPAWEAQPGLRTWISGDFHLQNVGFEDPAGGELCFDLNDFDESCPAPFYWDLIRMVASVYLVRDSKDGPSAAKDEEGAKNEKERLGFDLSEEKADDLTVKFLHTYHETIAANAIAPLTAKEIDEPGDRGKSKAGRGFVREGLATIEETRAKKEKKFWDKETGGSRIGFDLPPEGEPAKKARFAKLDEKLDAQIEASWHAYIDSLDPAFVRSVAPGYFKPLDKAERLGSGLGSLGVLKIYILIAGRSEAPDDNVILEAKASAIASEVETKALALAPTAGGEGKRVSDATRAMSGRRDDHEGWFKPGQTSYHVTRISPLAGSADLNDFKKPVELEDFLRWSAVALANAHCRSTPRFAIEALRAFPTSQELEQAIQKLGRDYAAQVREDHREFSSK